MLKTTATLLLLVIAMASPLRAEAQPAETRAVSTAVEKSAAEEKQAELMTFDWQSAAWTLVIFLILWAVLYKTAWKNVLVGLKSREERIRNDIAQAEEARLKAEATLKEYNQQLAIAEAKGREILAKSTLDAHALAERIKADADKAAKERAERAVREINDTRDQALRDIYEQAADLSTSIAEKILRRSLNAGDQRDLVAQSLEQVQSINRG